MTTKEFQDAAEIEANTPINTPWPNAARNRALGIVQRLNDLAYDTMVMLDDNSLGVEFGSTGYVHYITLSTTLLYDSETDTAEELDYAKVKAKILTHARNLLTAYSSSQLQHEIDARKYRLLRENWETVRQRLKISADLEDILMELAPADKTETQPE